MPSINERISVYTTRVDTIYGVSYVVLAPEHPYVERLIENAPNKTDLDAFYYAYAQYERYRPHVYRST